MGFYIMIFSAIIGLFLVALGILKLKGSKYDKISIGIGVIFILFSIYMALSK